MDMVLPKTTRTDANLPLFVAQHAWRAAEADKTGTAVDTLRVVRSHAVDAVRAR